MLFQSEMKYFLLQTFPQNYDHGKVNLVGRRIYSSRFADGNSFPNRFFGETYRGDPVASLLPKLNTHIVKERQLLPSVVSIYTARLFLPTVTEYTVASNNKLM